MYRDEASQKETGRIGWTSFGSVMTMLALASVGVLLVLTINQNQIILHNLQHRAAVGPGAVDAYTKSVQSWGKATSAGKTFFFDPQRTRNDLGLLLEARGYTVGAELGVQRGHFSATTLRNWPSCKTYYLIDVWRTQVHYDDVANVPQEVQDKLYVEAQNNLRQWQAITRFYRNFTSDAAKLIIEPLDYVYVDARHDYCGVMEDISLYWPKIKSGGVMAGHDYLDAAEAEKHSGQHWEKCIDGSMHPGAVRGAVNEFFKKLSIPVFVTYQDAPWVSWLVIKP